MTKVETSLRLEEMNKEYLELCKTFMVKKTYEELEVILSLVLITLNFQILGEMSGGGES
ncbi:hypothetical protein HN682_01995 [Candidatus Peregrinibacteria bacterium]|jgi:hypothetical protein|nr:hypothetical protein [Candidatus Scalindua sp.]MBT7928678.1 hypothetical protein [Candidatus Peregrinibacteria bacterium]